LQTVAATEFEGVVEAGRGGGAFVELPAEVLDALGGGKRFHVRGTLNGVDFASSTMPMGGGRVCLGLHKATREHAGVAPGDAIRLSVERAERPEVEVPDELKEALASDPEAAAAFERLAHTHRREYAQWVAEAKKPETRARRVQQTLERLHEPQG
jgi:Bacteriocin-protection, YdeI or OmpD-Associated/Domain of unknown function (DUF1905)